MVSEFIQASLNSEINGENFPELSAQELSDAQERQNLISNRVEVGLKFVDILGDKTDISNSSNPESDPAYEASINILKGVTSDSSTVTDKVEFLESIKGDSDPIERINSYSVAKITIYNRAYSTHNIVGVYITASDYKSWGYNYIDFKIEPDYHLSKPIEIGSCSEKNDIRIVYDNDRKFEYYNIDYRVWERLHFND